jgi:hypothetical protein
MSKTEYQIECREAFNRMIESRNDAKHGRRTRVAPHGPVVVVMILPVRSPRPTLAEIHFAADARMGSCYVRLCAETNAMLADIRLDGLAKRLAED